MKPQSCPVPHLGLAKLLTRSVVIQQHWGYLDVLPRGMVPTVQGAAVASGAAGGISCLFTSSWVSGVPLPMTPADPGTPLCLLECLVFHTLCSRLVTGLEHCCGALT